MGFFILGTFIPYYGFWLVVGIVCAFLFGLFLCKKTNLNTDDFTIICAYLIAFGFLGAKILYILVSLNKLDFHFIFKDMKSFNYFIGSGFVFYGGIIGGFLALIFVRKIYHIDVNHYLKCIVPSLCISHSFGRIGCSLAGCCHGRETTRNFYFLYTRSIIAPNNVKLFPVQGIEAAAVFLLGIICSILVLRKSKIRVEYFYIITYSIIRFILEFFRGDTERGFFLIFSTSQVISIFLFLTGLYFLFKTDKKNLKAIK